MKITVYSTSWCGPCNNAKQLLNSRGLNFTEVDIEEIGWTRDDLFEKTGGRTVPQIFIDGRTIGGFDDLLVLDRDGKLNR